MRIENCAMEMDMIGREKVTSTQLWQSGGIITGAINCPPVLTQTQTLLAIELKNDGRKMKWRLLEG